MGRNLRQSLDLNHRAQSELTIKVLSMADYGLSLPQLVMALMLVGMGVMCYYFAPLAFLYGEVELFALITNMILLAMILGLTFLALLVLPGLQAGVVHALLAVFACDRKLKTLVLKNMESHQSRNRNTAIMFSVALSFLIFAGCIFQLVGGVMQKAVSSQVAGDIRTVNIRPAALDSLLDEDKLTEYLAAQRDLDGAVHDWAFTAPTL